MQASDPFVTVKLKLAIKHALEELQVELQKNEEMRSRPALSDVVQRLLDTYTALPQRATELLPRNEEEEKLMLGLVRLYRDEHTSDQLRRAVATLLSSWSNRRPEAKSSKKHA